MYLNLELVTTNGQTTQAIYQHSTLEEATSAYHSTLAYQMANPDCTACLAMVIGEDGAVYRSEKYTKPAAATEA